MHDDAKTGDRRAFSNEPGEIVQQAKDVQARAWREFGRRVGFGAAVEIARRGGLGDLKTALDSKFRRRRNRP